MSKLMVFCLDALCTLDIEYMKTLPNFGWLIKEGSYVKHVEPVYPSLTYPCHCSIITGKTVKGHGIAHNEIVDALDPNAPWYQYYSQMKTRTLLDLAHDYGKTTASITWPVSGGADIDFNLPMIVPLAYQGNHPEKFYENYATQELIDRYFWKYKHYLRGIDASLDSFTMEVSLDILEDYGQPDIMLVKMCDLDSVRHNYGINNDKVKAQLRKHDDEFSRLIEAVKRYGDFEDTNFVILGDHGQQDCQEYINFNMLLKQRGYITTDENNKIISYKAYCHSASMSAWIELKDPSDEKLRKEIYDFLLEVRDDPKYNIGYVYTKKEAYDLFGLENEKIDFVIEGRKPMSFDSTLDGKDLFSEYLREGWHHTAASHGYLPFKDETTTFLACGKNVKKGKIIERSSMLNEASTMALMLGMEMKDTEGEPWTDIIK